jgi:hypothetical protein
MARKTEKQPPRRSEDRGENTKSGIMDGSGRPGMD